MKTTQLTKGKTRRVMYVESKGEPIDGAAARIGWVTFSRTGRTVEYKGLRLGRIKGGGYPGNFVDPESGTAYWVSGVKRRGSNSHPAEAAIVVAVDPDAMEEYENIRSGLDSTIKCNTPTG